MADEAFDNLKPEDMANDIKLELGDDAGSPGTPGAQNGTRRPPRKSTLTQQQKNQKRQRATQDQLSTLEVEFNKTPTPTAADRERIANDINMTERSVQIWFQNRRAKIKNLAKKSIETGEDCDAIPESMRKYLALQAIDSGKPLVRDLANRGLGGPFNNGLIVNTDSQAKVLISHLQCRSLSIGTWRRISQTALDLVVFYSPAKAMFTYYINADSSGFKIEYPFSSIKNITLDTGDASAGAEGASQRSGGLLVELTQPPMFSMDPGSGGFFQCRDFTEDQQASKVLTHHLGGHSKILSGQLAKLVSLESFRNRHLPFSMPEPHTVTMSAPVSPVGIPRPASQPNQMLHPHMAYNDKMHPGMGPPAQPPSRLGHKRQRSRSVPAAIDYTQLRRPMPPFLAHEMPLHMQLQHQHMHSHIHAPIPQYATHPPQPHPQMAQQFPGHNISVELSINTSAAGYDFEFRSGPLSATTVNSSEVDPNFFPVAPPSDTHTTSNLNTPYNGTFYSPMINPSSLSNPPLSPYTTLSHADPVIANQSPPLGSYDGRSASAELYQEPHEQAAFQDESFNFNDMYSKQQPPMQLPFRSPAAESAPPPEPDFDFGNLVSFDGSANSMSPDASQFASGT